MEAEGSTEEGERKSQQIFASDSLKIGSSLDSESQLNFFLEMVTLLLFNVNGALHR